MKTYKIYLAGRVHDSIKWKMVDGIKNAKFIASDGGNHSAHDAGACNGWCDGMESTMRDFVQENFCHQVKQCDFLLAILDQPESYGSVAEIAWAAANGIACHVVVVYDLDVDGSDSGNEDAYWFVSMLPNVTLHLCQTMDEMRAKVWSVCGKLMHADYLQSEEWKVRRLAAIKNAGGRCELCNAASLLQVHHRTYENWGNENEGDLTVLCDSCHKRFHYPSSQSTLRSL